MPSVQELKDANTLLAKTSKDDLLVVPLRDSVIKVAGKYTAAIDLMSRYSTNFDSNLKLSLGQVAANKTSTIEAMVAAGQTEAAARTTLGNRLEQQATQALAMKIINSVRNQSTLLAQGIITALQAVEEEYDRLVADQLTPDSVKNRDNEELKDLLSESKIERDLSVFTPQELQKWMHSELRLNPTRGLSLLGIIYRIATERSSAAYAQKQARTSAEPTRTNFYTQQAGIYRSILSEIQAIREANVNPDIEMFDTKIKPQLDFLTRSIIGVDPRTLPMASFEAYAKTYKPGQRLSQTPVLDGWILRHRLQPSAVDPKVSYNMPATFSTMGSGR